MIKVIILLKLLNIYGAQTNKLCFIDNNFILIESNQVPYNNECEYASYIDLESNQIMDFDGKNVISYLLSFDDNWEAYQPISLEYKIERTEFSLLSKGHDFFDLSIYSHQGQIQDQYLLHKTTILNENQLKALKLDFNYEGNVYMIIEHVKHKREVLFEKMSVEVFDNLGQEDILKAKEKIKNIFKN